ncbi:thiamine pyrophosphate-binding protein [Mycobacterium sp. KBS0706]|uniref:thiamine pyrophosphate-binding protein n=1 Tax=Mycobacterium sp. KBS0706 TaxID=2578109 RepID=UPI001C8F2A51|nr:thiamine pyrophosphate-binding protein [Mycobacterium sp. KBS0706]
MTRIADTIAATLHDHGIRHAFGMPGGEVVTLIDGLEAAGIRFHLARHETAAAIMAAGASVTTATPGLLVATVGPGLANAVNGIADAAQEHVPLVVISGIVDRPTRARYTHQVIDHAAMLRPLVKASFEVEPESAGQTVARALAIALAEPMGPVHLDLSPAVAAMPDPAPRPVAPPAVLRPAVAPQDPAIAALAERLSQARRPLILAGLEAAQGGAGPALLRLAERLGAPVVTTYKAKGLVPEDHPLALGGAGLSPLADAVLLPLFARADLLLFVGYDPIEMRLGWLDPVSDPDRIVEITAAPADHAMHHAGTRLLAAPAAAIEALAEAISADNCQEGGGVSNCLSRLAGEVGRPQDDRVRAGSGLDKIPSPGAAGAAPTSPASGRGNLEAEKATQTWTDGEPAVARAALVKRFAAPAEWGPHAIVEVLNRAVGEGDLVTVDAGAHRILLSQKWVARRPLSLLQSTGFCTMAAALPLAIGAKVADPSRRIVAVMGDGGLEMGIGELATLRDLGLPVTIVLFQDQSLALIALKQNSAGLAPHGVGLGLTDFAAVAAGFGGHGRTVASGTELAAELAAARDRDRFTLIVCRFDADAYHQAF